MKRLQTYIMLDVAKAFVVAFGALLLIMVVGFSLQLLRDGLDVVRLRGLLPPLLTYCAPMVLPSAFLTAVIMTFGRLSADNELTAVRAAGVHTFSIIWPVLACAVALSVGAAYLQFELVPRARGAVQALRYQALQQMLLDRAALSARREFSFKPVFIRYDGYRDGKLTGLLLLQCQNRRPRTVVTARNATMSLEKANGTNVMVFEMRDCVMTEFDLEQYGEAVTTVSGEGSLRVRVGPNPEELKRQDRYLPARALLARLAELRARVAAEPRVPNPGEVHDRAKAELRVKLAELDELDRTLARARVRYQRYAELEPRRINARLAKSEQDAAKTNEELADLRRQQLDVLGQIKKAQDAGTGQTDYDRLVELQKRYKALQADLDSHRKRLKELEAEVADAKAELAEVRRIAAERNEELKLLQPRRDALSAEVAKLKLLERSAGDQQTLREIWVRIHKRLALATSVFVFALLGIPLGIGAGGRSVMAAFGISFAIVLLVFYPMLALGQMAANNDLVAPAPAMWAGNALTFLAGSVLTISAVKR